MDRYGNYQAPVPGGAVRRAHETMGAGEDTSGVISILKTASAYFGAAPCATRRIERWRETVSVEPSQRPDEASGQPITGDGGDGWHVDPHRETPH
jgi:hypothetical protein